jgi:flavin-dependent dehydrogenase
MYDVAIIGGGLAGLTNAVHLSKAGLKVLLVEKNNYPTHKVCGEYISNEVIGYLDSIGIYPFKTGAVAIDKFLLSTQKGKTTKANLPLGGFGLSRYALDNLLFKKALANGCVIKKAIVETIEFQNNYFKTTTRDGSAYQATFVIGAYGKRSRLDHKLDRDFIKTTTPYLAVKCHYSGDFPQDLVALHNFEGGYCGVSKVENEILNVCYLADANSFKTYRNTKTFQEQVLCKNPHLKELFSRIKPIFEKPLTISQISFSQKATVKDHILMSGDAAGMVHPLCGNGMGMAIQSAQLLSNLLLEYTSNKNQNRTWLESNYTKEWNKVFQKRLLAGRIINRFFSNHNMLDKGLGLLRLFPFALPYIIKQTHGTSI